MKKAFLFLGVIAAAAVAGGATAWVLTDGAQEHVTYIDRTAATVPSAGTHFTSYQADNYPDLTYAAENAVQAVVNIEVVQKVEVPQSNYGYDPFLEFFGLPQQRGGNEPRYQERRGGGSGVILSPDGYIVTNNHVADGATTLRVKLNDGRKFDAKLIGKDAATDLALLKIDAENLPTLPLG
ncbi:MAG: S1C family serine protease, partial [Alistipes sp.]|nr:S1C family serine protease [Alistipes sp.]